MRGFSTDPDREAAMREALARRKATSAREATAREAALCADELARCVADGVEDWSAIKLRLRARCGVG